MVIHTDRKKLDFAVTDKSLDDCRYKQVQIHYHNAATITIFRNEISAFPCDDWVNKHSLIYICIYYA